MDYPALVHVVDDINQLVHDGYELSIFNFKRVNMVEQRASGHLLHYYSDVGLVLKYFFHFDDILVIDHFDDLQFSLYEW